MSIRDDFAAFVEDIGAEIGVPVKCRKMRRPAYEWDGEWFPAYYEYEAREDHEPHKPYRLWLFDDTHAELPREDAREVIVMHLRVR